MLELILALLLGSPEVCNSTTFGTPGDKWVGGKALLLKRRVNQTDIGVAHRTHKLGSYVVIRNERNGRYAVAPVIDRGPYGALAACHLVKDKKEAVPRKGKCWYVKKKRRWPGRWRGCLDLTPALGKQLGHDGWDRVSVWRL